MPTGNTAPRTATQMNHAQVNVAVAQEANRDWASDPCRRCGKWPLSIFNKCGYCRECSRRHVTHKNIQNRGLGNWRVRDSAGRFVSFSSQAA
jgi:hypothetical protein